MHIRHRYRLITPQFIYESHVKDQKKHIKMNFQTKINTEKVSQSTLNNRMFTIVCYIGEVKPNK